MDPEVGGAVIFVLAVVGFPALLCALIAGLISADRGRPMLGWTIGLMFGPFGVLVACFLPRWREPGEPSRDNDRAEAGDPLAFLNDR